MPDEELAEVYGEPPVHEVEEHQTVVVVLLDTDGQLVGEATHRPLSSAAEGDMRVVVRLEVVVALQAEEPPLVVSRTQPRAAPIAEHGVEDHHALDHAPDVTQAAVPVVGLADRFVERLVVDVVQPSASYPSWFDDTDEATRHQTRHERAAVLAAYRPGERAVLPFEEEARVDHDGHQKPPLTLGEPEAGERRDARRGDAVRDIGEGEFACHRNSSIPRRRGPDRPPPPPRAPET